MQLTINVECSPEEARAFLGLPNVAPLNELLVQNVMNAVETNRELTDPSELLKQWMAFGGAMQDQFWSVMSASARAATGDVAGAASGSAKSPKSSGKA